MQEPGVLVVEEGSGRAWWLVDEGYLEAEGEKMQTECTSKEEKTRDGKGGIWM